MMVFKPFYMGRRHLIYNRGSLYIHTRLYWLCGGARGSENISSCHQR